MKTLTSKSIYISIFFFSIYIIIDLFRNSYFRYFFWGSWSLSTRPHSPKVYKFSKHTFPAFWFLSVSSINFSFFLNWGKDFYSCFNRDWFSKIFRDFTFDLLRYFSVKRKHIISAIHAEVLKTKYIFNTVIISFLAFFVINYKI